ncbi:MAG TPA: type II secretion system F family protein [Acidimicrobiales bacterium]|nr:type II secretion system F family protein [Acidimicrobiales bacterium]
MEYQPGPEAHGQPALPSPGHGAPTGSSRPVPGGPVTATVPLASPPAWVASALADADMDLDPARTWRLWLVTVLLAGAAGASAGAATAALAVAAVMAGPLVAWCLLRRRSDDRLEAALPEAVDAIARALRTGASLRLAVAEAAAATPGRLGTELMSVARATERGAGVVPALEAWAERQPTPGVRLVAGALCLGAETGGVLARAVDGVAATLRQRLEARADAKALATQARMSAAVLAAAPLVFAALASLADARTSAFLFRTSTGLLCLAGGLVLDAAGALWMARLTRIEVD